MIEDDWKGICFFKLIRLCSFWLRPNPLTLQITSPSSSSPTYHYFGWLVLTIVSSQFNLRQYLVSWQGFSYVIKTFQSSSEVKSVSRQAWKRHRKQDLYFYRETRVSPIYYFASHVLFMTPRLHSLYAFLQPCCNGGDLLLATFSPSRMSNFEVLK